MSETIIKVENLSKLYRLGEIGTGSLWRDLSRWWARSRGKEDPFAIIGSENTLNQPARRSLDDGGKSEVRSQKSEIEFVWALKDINFEVKQGEVLGIIGKNGAGKSTLLKILSRVTTPTTGLVKVKGRIASLLEVGTGFHPELTGRENTFLNGAILGMTKAEIRSKFDEIVEFAGVAKYIDTPVKRYSSGMYVRLAFAVAAHLEPEILVVDEVLAVGDSEFQKKALGKMQDISTRDGRTVLFVSHNMPSIKNLCKSAILLKNGLINFSGASTEVVDYYSSDYNVFETRKSVIIDDSYRIYKHFHLNEIKFVNLEFTNISNNNALAVTDNITLSITVKAIKTIDNFRFAIGIFSIDDTCIGVHFSPDILFIKDNEQKTYFITIKNHQLAKGQYYLNFSVGTGNEINGFQDFDHISKSLFFEISYKDLNHTDMITKWDNSWGKINFQDITIAE